MSRALVNPKTRVVKALNTMSAGARHRCPRAVTRPPGASTGIAVVHTPRRTDRDGGRRRDGAAAARYSDSVPYIADPPAIGDSAADITGGEA